MIIYYKGVKSMKKIVNVLIVLMFLISMFCVPVNAEKSDKKDIKELLIQLEIVCVKKDGEKTIRQINIKKIKETTYSWFNQTNYTP